MTEPSKPPKREPRRPGRALAIAALVSGSGCSLLFDAPAQVASDGQNLGPDSDSDPGPIDAGPLGDSSCGSMAELEQSNLTGDLNPVFWQFSTEEFVPVAGNLELDLSVLVEGKLHEMRGAKVYSPPFALDIHVSNIPNTASAQIDLVFEYQTLTNDFVQVSIRGSGLSLNARLDGSMYSASYSRLSAADSDYYVRMSQASDTVIVEHSVDAQTWNHLNSLDIIDTSTRPKITAGFTEPLGNPPPEFPVVLHGIGSSCR